MLFPAFRPFAAAAPVSQGEFAPGAWVRHAARPDWGRGQVQSATGARVTVNFEHAGKVLVNTDHATLLPVHDRPEDGA